MPLAFICRCIVCRPPRSCSCSTCLKIRAAHAKGQNIDIGQTTVKFEAAATSPGFATQMIVEEEAPVVVYKCDVCKDTGKYVGLRKVEPCAACQGGKKK